MYWMQFFQRSREAKDCWPARTCLMLLHFYLKTEWCKNQLCQDWHSTAGCKPEVKLAVIERSQFQLKPTKKLLIKKLMLSIYTTWMQNLAELQPSKKVQFEIRALLLGYYLVGSVDGVIATLTVKVKPLWTWCLLTRQFDWRQLVASWAKAGDRRS